MPEFSTAFLTVFRKSLQANLTAESSLEDYFSFMSVKMAEYDSKLQCLGMPLETRNVLLTDLQSLLLSVDTLQRH